MNYFLNPSKKGSERSQSPVSIFDRRNLYCVWPFLCTIPQPAETIIQFWSWLVVKKTISNFLHIRNFKFPLSLKYICSYYRFNLFARLSVTVYRINGVYGILFMSKIVFGDIISKQQLLNIFVSESWTAFFVWSF